MELFTAANEDQWSLIKKVIDDCDYYLVVIAGRYGSIGPEGLSFTEMEYRYALENKKPIMAFIHKDIGKLPSNRVETEKEAKDRCAANCTLRLQSIDLFSQSKDFFGGAFVGFFVPSYPTHSRRCLYKANKASTYD